MITWAFNINGTQVEEPKGFSEIVLNISRDNQWHGIFFEAASSTLTFYGTAATILQAERNENGLAAEALFEVTATCGENVDVISGNFDFGTYREKCGNTCVVEIAVEKSGCIMTMRNRYDQKVDLSKTTAFDNITLLPNYTGLDVNLELTAQSIFLGNEANLDETLSELISGNTNWTGSGNTYNGYISVPLPVVTNASFGTFNTGSIIDLYLDNNDPFQSPWHPPYPDFPTSTGTAEISGTTTCELTDASSKFRIKGNTNVVFRNDPPDPAATVFCSLRLYRLPVGLDSTVSANWVLEYSTTILATTNTDGVVAFDTGDVTVPLTITQGDFIFWGVYTQSLRRQFVNTFSITFNSETYFKLLVSSTCPPTFADVTLVNETGSRIIEAITDGCLNMKSDYFGRTDSQPYISISDGCGSLRALASGLSIRNATPDNHFISLQEYFNGLRGIDNIGMGVENNAVVSGRDWLRVEPVEYFYQDIELLRLSFIPEADSNLNSSLGYSKILIGYDVWEVEKVNGLGEFNSNKEFRTSLKTIDNTLDAKSNFVAGGIPIEVTRQQSFATTGKADTKYDNETFVICVERGGYDYIVEKGNVDNPANIFSPLTVYNWRIRPMYNLMRWAKSIFQSYVNLSNTTSKMFFSSGTGNYIAGGQLPAGDPCKLESGVLAENNDLDKQDFAGTDYVPIYKPENITFEYPLSIRDYLLVKANPYGYISFQCGAGNYHKGFIKSLAYKPVEGIATFTLIKKWQ